MKFPDASITTKEGLISFLKNEIKIIDELTGNELLARIFGMVLYLNSLSNQQKIGVIDWIIKWLRKLKDKLDEIAKDWRVSNYSIGVSAPWEVEVSLTFAIP